MPTTENRCPTVQEIYTFIDAFAPFSTQADFDNCGLLVGDRDAAVTGLLAALDVTDAVLDEAEALGANLILTHHPLMLHGRRNLLAEDREGHLLVRMIRMGVSLIAAHTNLDAAPGGINDVLAAALGLTDVTGEGYVRTGDLQQPMAWPDFVRLAEESLRTVARPMGALPDGSPVRRVTVSSGGGSDSWEEAVRMGAQVFVSGEIKHHHALALADAGCMGLECGHFATEEPGIFALADALQKQFNGVQYHLCVYHSRAGSYAPRGTL